jgi:molybdopterin/thiamine biosynthesis adenylyltransferase
MDSDRYSRQSALFSDEEQSKLWNSTAVIVGCGGLGSQVITNLVSVGVGSFVLVDHDVVEESNLNRQVLSLPGNLGSRKAAAAADRVRAIDPSINVTAVCEYITKENAPALLADADLVMDALDNAGARLMLEDAAEEAGVTIIHGAIRGWDLQVMSVPPGSGLLHEIYGHSY